MIRAASGIPHRIQLGFDLHWIITKAKNSRVTVLTRLIFNTFSCKIASRARREKIPLSNFSLNNFWSTANRRRVKFFFSSCRTHTNAFVWNPIRKEKEKDAERLDFKVMQELQSSTCSCWPNSPFAHISQVRGEGDSRKLVVARKLERNASRSNGKWKLRQVCNKTMMIPCVNKVFR